MKLHARRRIKEITASWWYGWLAGLDLRLCDRKVLCSVEAGSKARREATTRQCMRWSINLVPMSVHALYIRASAYLRAPSGTLVMRQLIYVLRGGAGLATAALPRDHHHHAYGHAHARVPARDLGIDSHAIAFGPGIWLRAIRRKLCRVPKRYHAYRGGGVYPPKSAILSGSGAPALFMLHRYSEFLCRDEFHCSGRCVRARRPSSAVHSCGARPRVAIIVVAEQLIHVVAG